MPSHDADHQCQAFAAVHAELARLAADIVAVTGEHLPRFSQVDPQHRQGAINMLRYVAMRDHDLRQLQWRLHDLGLSSLGRAESHVGHSLQMLLANTHRLGEVAGPIPQPWRHPYETPSGARQRLRDHATQLLGPELPSCGNRIMVTAASEAAENPDLLHRLVAAGMRILRINCAHDEASAWQAMIDNVRLSPHPAAASVRIFMDLPGPKLRTGPLREELKGLRLHCGDLLELRADNQAGIEGQRDADGHLQQPHRIGCTEPSVIADVRTGEAVTFDDGKIGGIVREAEPNRLLIEITRCREPKGRKLKAEKGINFPDTDLSLNAPTDEDLSFLPFVIEHADIVGLSFARRPDDVQRLLAALPAEGEAGPGVVLKIEGRIGFENLPLMLCALMQRRRIGIMVARGDLAAEVGFERLAEVQEEMLWLCEAAQVPVIWATQVLESLAKDGVPSRGEISDAVYAARAECVMLNKGPGIVDAVRSLEDILGRMQKHQDKKMDLLRRLQSWNLADLQAAGAPAGAPSGPGAGHCC